MEVIGIPQKAPEEPKEPPKKQIRGKHTMSDDMTRALVATGGHNVKNAIAEEKERVKNQKAQKDIVFKNILFASSAIALVFVGISLVVWVIAWRERKIPVTINTYQMPIIAVERENPVLISVLNRDTFAQTLAQNIKSVTNSKETITSLPLYLIQDATRQPIAPDRIFGTLMASPIRALTDTLKQQSLLGIYTDKEGVSSPFLLARVGAYTTALTGMRTWEPTLFDDVHRVFGFEEEEKNKELFEAKFEETILRNQNSHVLKDKKGEVMLFYTFLGERKDTLLIGTSQNTLEEVVRRLTAPTLKR